MMTLKSSFHLLYKYLFNNKKKLIIYLIAFSLSKLVTLLSPLLLSNILEPKEYGMLEYNLGFALILGPVLSLGVGNAYAYYKFKKNEMAVASHSFYHILIVSAILFCIYLLNILLNTQNNILYLFVILIIGQQYINTYYQINGLPEKAVYWSSFIYFILLVYYLSIKIGYEIDANILYFVSAIVITVLFLQIYKKSYVPFAFKCYKESIKYGVQIVILSFIFQIYTSGGRIILEKYASIEVVGIYSFYFRISSIIPFLFYTMIYIFFFSKLYHESYSKIDHYYSMFTVLIVLLSFLSVTILPIVLKDHLEIFNTYCKYKNHFIFLCIHAITWIEIALLENIFYRENISKKFFPFIVIVTVIYASAILLLNNHEYMNALKFIKLNLFFNFGVIFTILLFLKKYLFNFRKLTILNIILVIVPIFLSFYI